MEWPRQLYTSWSRVLPPKEVDCLPTAQQWLFYRKTLAICYRIYFIETPKWQYYSLTKLCSKFFFNLWGFFQSHSWYANEQEVHVRGWLYYMDSIRVCCRVSAVFLLLKNLMSNFIAVIFHVPVAIQVQWSHWSDM